MIFSLWIAVWIGIQSAFAAPSADVQSTCWIVRGATVHTATGGPIFTDVVTAQGKIFAVGKDADGPKGVHCDTVDGRGKHLAPGFVSTPSQLGLFEIGMEASTRDGNAGGDSIRADFRVADAYNPLSSRIAIARNKGVTSAVLFPSGGSISGQAAWVDLAGTHQSEAVVHPSVAMIAQLGGESRAEGLRQLRTLLREAKAFPGVKAAYERNASRPLLADPADLEALQAVVRAEIPLVVGADRASDIEALLRLVDDTRIRLILQGGAEAWMHASALAEREVTVLVDPLVYGPGGFHQMRSRPDNAAILTQAGVNVVLTQGEMMTRSLGQAAGNAVRGGLSHQDALAAVTRNPARAFGLKNHGTIEPGGIANLLLWSGDPLEIGSRIETLIIHGRSIDQTSRHTELLERYRTLPGSPVAPLPLPEPDTKP
jgi:imidazolonepropionase-like amidohydrolase